MGRGAPHGERNGKVKLTADSVREIRRRRDAGEQLKSIAPDFGVSLSTVSLVVRFIAWRHVQAISPTELDAVE